MSAPSKQSLRNTLTGVAYSRWVGGAAAFFFGLGLIWHLLPQTTTLVRPLTPFVLIVFGLASMVPLLAAGGLRMLLWALVSYAAGFALEAVGVATGVVFGPYEYGTALGFHVLAVPPIIGLNWVVVIAGSASLSNLIVDKLTLLGGDRATPRAYIIAITALGAGILATAFDWIMEPAAIALDFWRWFTPEIPYRNYLTWFLFTTVTSVFFSMIHQRRRRQFPLETTYVTIQLAFFAGIRIAMAVGGLP